MKFGGLTFLSRRLEFPDPTRADAEGLVAIGGDFSAERLLLAYRSGIFPWTAEPLTWWSPDPRGIFELDQFYIPRSLDRFLRKKPFEITVDRAFRAVMEGCAMPAPGREETWITSEFLEAYTHLHELGHAHSLECWQGRELVGGIYGVQIGAFFAGESMFHQVSNASKVALYSLHTLLRKNAFQLFDVQMLTPATASLGALSIPRQQYLTRLAHAVKSKAEFKL